MIPRSNFVENVFRLNGLDATGFVSWEILPGMRFGEHEAWWRGRDARRDAPHEGVDLRGFRTWHGRSELLGPGTRIPVLWAGEVVAVVADFLDRSVFVAHEMRDKDGRRLHSIYGHLQPRPGLAPGYRLAASDEVGTLADPGKRRSVVPAHLHLSIALIAGGDAKGALDWGALRDPARTTLLDPLSVVCGRVCERNSSS